MESIAAVQHGLITLVQLVGLGLTSGAVTKRVTRGALHRVHRGVYSLVPLPALSSAARALAAVLAAGDGSVLSHLSAALLHAVWRRSAPPRISVTSPAQRRLDGVVVHRARRGLDPRDVTTEDGIPVTAMHRLFVDLTDVLIAQEIANVIHEAAFKGRFVEAAVRDAMDRANGRHNLAALDRAIGLYKLGCAGIRSGRELAFFNLVVANGFEEPLVNVHAHGWERDFLWPELRLAVELDGPGHIRPHTRADDDARDAILHAAGFAVVRFTLDPLDQSDRVLTRLRTREPVDRAA